MGAETELEASSTPRLLLLPKPHIHGHMESPERSGTLTPPIYATASVPFLWEEEPGKPRQCFNPLSNHMDLAHSRRCLELPPRLLMHANVTELASPTTVLEGPFYGGKSRFQSSSFRIIRRECYGSFHRSCSLERGNQLGTMVLSKRGLKDGRFLGSWRKVFKAKREVGGGGNYVYPSSIEGDVNWSIEETGKKAKITSKRAGSFSTLSHVKSEFWTTIYEGLKQVVPWRSKKLKKDGFQFRARQDTDR